VIFLVNTEDSWRHRHQVAATGAQHSPPPPEEGGGLIWHVQRPVPG
jgi:hypothetical protein